MCASVCRKRNPGLGVWRVRCCWMHMQLTGSGPGGPQTIPKGFCNLSICDLSVCACVSLHALTSDWQKRELDNDGIPPWPKCDRSGEISELVLARCVYLGSSWKKHAAPLCAGPGPVPNSRTGLPIACGHGARKTTGSTNITLNTSSLTALEDSW